MDVSEKALQKAKTLGATQLIQVQAPINRPKAVADEIVRVPQQEDGIDLTLDAAGFPITSEAAVLATGVAWSKSDYPILHRQLP